jgi:hypothetical protein
MYTCPLKKLDLILNALSPIALAGLLKRVKRDDSHVLQTFIYSHQELTVRQSYECFDGSGFIKVLL